MDLKRVSHRIVIQIRMYIFKEMCNMIFRMIFVAPLNGNKFTLAEQLHERSSKSATLDRAVALLLARSIILPVGLLTNCETRRFHSLAWENRRDGSRIMGPTLWEPTLRVSNDACRQGIYVQLYTCVRWFDRSAYRSVFIYIPSSARTWYH